MKSFSNAQIEKMYFNAKARGLADKATRYLDILRERMTDPAKEAKGLVLELRDVREHERDGVEVCEHVKGYWVKEVA